MKTKNYITPILVFLIVFPCLSGKGRYDAFTKTIKKSFSVDAEPQLTIKNQFGDITCTLWDKNEVSLEVTVTVEARSNETAGDLLSGVDIVCSQNGSAVDVKTTFSTGFKPKTSFSIDYNVFMPAHTQLNLTNKFGDVILADLNSRSHICVEHGRLEAKQLNHGDNLVEISFGSASLESVKGIVLNIKHSQFEAGYIGSIRLNSDYSEISCEKLIVADGTLTGGSLDIGDNSVSKLKSRFASIHIEKLDKKFEIIGEYGNVEVDQVSTGFQIIDIDNKFGNYEIRIPDEVSYTLDASTHFGNIEFNGEKAAFSLREVSDYDQIFQGRIGENPSATVKVRSEFGRISLH